MASDDQQTRILEVLTEAVLCLDPHQRGCFLDAAVLAGPDIWAEVRALVNHAVEARREDFLNG
jgi:hypothetical protein